MKIEIKLSNVEYTILQITSREISLLTTALLETIKDTEKDSETYYYLKEMISKIEEAVKKVDTL